VNVAFVWNHVNGVLASGWHHLLKVSLLVHKVGLQKRVTLRHECCDDERQDTFWEGRGPNHLLRTIRSIHSLLTICLPVTCAISFQHGPRHYMEGLSPRRCTWDTVLKVLPDFITIFLAIVHIGVAQIFQMTCHKAIAVVRIVYCQLLLGSGCLSVNS
jgi:hypothetical protein